MAERQAPRINPTAELPYEYIRDCLLSLKITPGGDSTLFLNSCTGCHSGMDPMAQAFAYFEFDDGLGRVIHTPGQVQDKYLINATTFPLGF